MRNKSKRRIRSTKSNKRRGTKRKIIGPGRRRKRQRISNKKAGVSDREHLNELRYLYNRIGSLADTTWGKLETPDMIRFASIHHRSKTRIDDCCDECRSNNNTSSCYRKCVQNEIDLAEEDLRKEAARTKIDRFLKKSIPKYRVGVFNTTRKGQLIRDTNPMLSRKIRTFVS